MSHNIESKSDKLLMNPYLKRTGLLFTLIAVYVVSFRDTHVLSKPPFGYAQAKQEKQNGSQQAVKHAEKSFISASTEPYRNRWQRRFSSAENKGQYFFFKHIRKAGGTSLRSYFKDVFNYHGINHTGKKDYSKIKHSNGNITPEVLYVEHEFQTMDAECPLVDGRWDRSLRHPIERHMSEFFFSGPGNKFQIDRTQLYINQTYTQQLSEFLAENVPVWMEQEGGGKNSMSRYGKMEGRMNMFFGRFYTNNFQLRALAGCSSEKCLQKRLGKSDDIPEEIMRLHPSSNKSLYQLPNPSCTQYFFKESTLFDPCAKSRYRRDVCALGCDGPCFYPSVAWGPLDESDVEHAIKALEAFDIVLLMETYDDPDQSAFLADVLGVPRDAEFALSNHNASYVRVQKTNKRDKTHFYRDLLQKLRPDLLKALTEANKLEIDFFEKAVIVNQQKTDEWKRETSWEQT